MDKEDKSYLRGFLKDYISLLEALKVSREEPYINHVDRKIPKIKEQIRKLDE